MFVRITFWSLLVAVAAVISFAREAPRVQANHAPALHSEGIGYDGIFEDFGWVNVYVGPTAFGDQSATAIESWRNYHNSNLWWLRYTADPSDVLAPAGGAQVIDAYRAQSDFLFGDVAFYACNSTIGANQTTVAGVTIMIDKNGNFRGTDGSGFWAQAHGVPFWRATVCLNPDLPNDVGVGIVAHELGHTLGLDHITSGRSIPPPVPFATCPDTGLLSIMAYPTTY